MVESVSKISPKYSEGQPSEFCATRSFEGTCEANRKYQRGGKAFVNSFLLVSTIVGCGNQQSKKVIYCN